MSKYQFVTSHSNDMVGLTLFNQDQNVVWHADFDRHQAQIFVDALNGKGDFGRIYPKNWVVSVMQEDLCSVVLIGDDGPYLRFKVLLSKTETKDLATTMQSHIYASESDGRPKDIVAPLDDTLNGGWSPDKEKQMYKDDPDEDDPADRWKRGQ